MEITTTLYVRDRKEWRRWLEEHQTEREIWLEYPQKGSDKPRIPYDDAVEEALCFGWIDGIAKRKSDGSSFQRFTPRRKKSNWSELNKERARRLVAQGKMTPAGFAVLCDLTPVPLLVAADIEAALRAGDGRAWEHFEKFPATYKRIRIGFLEEVRRRPAVFEQRLNYFVKMTAQNKRYGTLTE